MVQSDIAVAYEDGGVRTAWGAFGFMPCPTKLVVAMGTPIPSLQTENPSQGQIDALHAAFVKAIRDLHDRYKHKMGLEWARSHDRLYLENQRLPTNVKED